MARDRNAVQVDDADLDFTRWSAQELAATIDQIEEDNAAIKARVSDEQDPPSEEECAQLEADFDQNEGLKADMKAHLETIQARVTAFKARIPDRPARTVNRPDLSGASASVPSSDTKARIEAGESEAEKYINLGPFKSFGHFCHEIKLAGQQPGLSQTGILGEWNARVGKLDRDYKAMDADTKALSGWGELVDSEGSAFVPVQIAAGIMERSKEQLSLLSMVDATPVTGNSLTLKAWNDKTASATTGFYGGTLAYWRAQASQMQGSKPSTRDINLKLKDLYVLFYAADELMHDTTAMEAEITKTAAYAITRKTNEAIIRGTGSGQPLGILNSPAKITATAVSGQGSNTFVAKNVDAMWARRAPDSADRCVWLYNIDCETEFASFNYNVANTGAQWVYVPAGGLTGKPFDTLKGRRMIETAHCSALGTEGDVILFDPASYKAIVKSSGVNQAVSMHLRFDYGETAFRWTFRMDGQCTWDAPFTPERGSTRSPIVTLNSTRT